METGREFDDPIAAKLRGFGPMGLLAGKLFGSSVAAKVAIVLFTSLVFASLHYPDQHLAGAEQALISGLIFGTIFAVTGRIWMIVIAHAAFDIAALGMIYWNLETNIAHWFFK